MASKLSQDGNLTIADVSTTHHAKTDISELERVHSEREGLEKEHIDYDRVDQELAKYAHTSRVEISPEENQRLKKMIDKRILPVMVFTYFLQALDKGTM